LKRLKVGVIGAGSWGKNHLRVFSELETAELVAVCDREEARAKSLGERYGIAYYSRFKDLLEREAVEAVTICTPTITHFEIAFESIERGRHVFVEKPMVSTSEEAERLLTKAEEKGVKLMVGFIERFNPGVQRVKSLIESGVFGEVVLAFARRVGRWPERIGDVGVVKDTAIHDLDIMRFIFEQEPRSLYARMGSLGHRYEDYAQIMLGFHGIQTGFIEANWLTPQKKRTLTVTCENAIVTLDYLTQKISVEDVYGLRDVSSKWEEPLMRELRDFVESVVKDRTPSVTGMDGLKALTLAELAIASAEKNTVITSANPPE
jgi:UDP-N-acetylglucosamine 3-dehydrogenase